MDATNSSPLETPAVFENVVVPPPLTFRVIGVGETGCRVASRMMPRGLADVTFAGVDTDARALADAGLPASVLLGGRATRGLSAGGDANQARAMAEAQADQLRALCEGADIVFVLAGLGRGTGTGVSPMLARLARESDALVLAVVTLPFEFEGPQLHRLAQAGLEQLRGEADGVICLPNQALARILDENTSLAESERITFDLLAEGVTAVWRLLTRKGFLRVDFGDLCQLLRGRHADSAIGTAEASGEQRAREAVEKLLAHPLLGQNQALARADALMISLVGGPDLTRSQVSWVVEQFRRQAESADIVVGASVEDTMSGKLGLTVVTAKRRPLDGETSAEAEEREPEVRPQAAAPAAASSAPASAGPAIATHFFTELETPRPPARVLPPAPELTREQQEQILTRQGGGSAKARRAVAKLRQGVLPLEAVSKGRFDKSEATIRDGQDLDIPTFLRRNMALN